MSGWGSLVVSPAIVFLAVGITAFAVILFTIWASWLNRR